MNSLFLSCSWLVWAYFFLEFVYHSVEVFFYVGMQLFVTIACHESSWGLLGHKRKWLTARTSYALVEGILGWSCWRVLVTKRVRLLHSTLLLSRTISCHVRPSGLLTSLNFLRFLKWTIENYSEVLSVDDSFACKARVGLHEEVKVSLSYLCHL